MQEGTILVTKSTLNKALLQNQAICKEEDNTSFVNSKYKLFNIFDLNKVNLFDVANVDETQMKPIPHNGPEILSILKENDAQGFDKTAIYVGERIPALNSSNFARKYLLIDAVECDPGLMQDEWLLANRPDLVENGIETLKRISNFYRCVIVSRRDAKLSNAETIVVDYGYQLCEEKALVKTTLGIDVAPNETSEENGVLVCKLQTAIEIGLIAAGITEKTRFLTVANLETGEAKVVRAPFGYPISELLRIIFGKPEGLKAYCGTGALNVHPLEKLPTVSYETSFVCYAKAPAINDPSSCTACGECETICPKEIPVPALIETWNISKKFKPFQKVNQKQYSNVNVLDSLKACIKCKACTYNCEGGIDPYGLLMKRLPIEMESDAKAKMDDFEEQMTMKFKLNIE